jgi:hypothetical protein
LNQKKKRVEPKKVEVEKEQFKPKTVEVEKKKTV